MTTTLENPKETRVELEKAVIGSLLCNPKAAKDCQLSDSNFTSEFRKNVFCVIKMVNWSPGRRIEPFSLTKRLSQAHCRFTFREVYELYSVVPSGDNWEYYSDLLANQ